MTTLAHLSDIHLAPLPRAKPRELMNKRLTGYLNWRLRRQNSLDGLRLAALVAHLHGQAPDFTCVTGDLVNLALDAEIATALGWLKGIGPVDKVCVSPGNHDAYLPQALEHACEFWEGYVRGETLDESPFPYVRRIGQVAVIACSSAVPTPPFFAAGRFAKPQAARLTRILKLLGEGDFFRVVMIHHPPNIESQTPRAGLWGAELFREVIAETGAEIVLHGHTHRSTIHSIPGRAGDVPVIGVAAAGTGEHPKPNDEPARYNLFRIERSGPTWTCSMTEYGYQHVGDDVTQLLQVRIY